MRLLHSAFAAVFLLSANGGSAQGVVVDAGQFSIAIGGRAVGVEDFTIRATGLGREDAVFANGVVSTDGAGGPQEVRPLLRAAPPEGSAVSYQVGVRGREAMELRLARGDRRYVATIQSEVGDEDREFQAREGTRVIERGVAHHYYFLRDLREGEAVNVLEPRTRRQLTLTAGPRSDEELRMGPNVVSSQRIEFVSDQNDSRIVWFDRQGRVLRVEIPSLGWVAERTDLVG